MTAPKKARFTGQENKDIIVMPWPAWDLHSVCVTCFFFLRPPLPPNINVGTEKLFVSVPRDLVRMRVQHWMEGERGTEKPGENLMLSIGYCWGVRCFEAPCFSSTWSWTHARSTLNGSGRGMETPGENLRLSIDRCWGLVAFWIHLWLVQDMSNTIWPEAYYTQTHTPTLHGFFSLHTARSSDSPAP